ncbi:DUF2070 family protein [Acidianus sulfidivorans]|uniref:DUF2070 family protein n=1 Tax=Acidianus sulfidivorans TaxID=312539 RepID=UPI0013A5A01A|nr:DUF2070 family protein [Acidianus sulfidivorans]
MDSEKLTRRYYSDYSKVISIPSTKILISINVIESALIILRSLEIGLLFFYSFAIYFIYILLIFWQRIKTSLIMTMLFSVIYLIFSFLPISYIFAFGAFIPLINYPLLLDHNEKTAFLLSLGSGLVPSIILLRISFLGIIYVLIVGLVSLIYIYYINKKGNKIIGIPSLSVIRPFIRAFSYKKDEELENFLEKISVPAMLNIATFKIGDVYFVLPQIHFGMYGNIGSSKFPYQVEEYLKNAIVFHTPGSHELDLASSKESKKVALSILQTKFEKINFSGIERQNIGDFIITSLRFDKASISFVQRPNKGIDDLPGGLWRDMSLTKNFLVDCHNETLVEEIGKKEYLELREFVRTTKLLPKSSLQIGYSESKVNCEGLCKDIAKAVTIIDKNTKQKLSIIYIYANNACHGLKDKIYEKISDIVDYPILVTPDDHSCTASTFGNLYQPATVCDDLIEKSRTLVLESIKNAKDADNIEFGVIKVKTRVLGKIISSMVEGLEKVGSFTLKTFWIPIILPYVILFVMLLANSALKI